jgi:hypothetical protein
MNYKLENGKTKSPIDRNIIYINIILDDCKINIVERHESDRAMDYGWDVKDVFFRVRTLNDEILINKQGNTKNHFKGDDFHSYYKLGKRLCNPLKGQEEEAKKAYAEFVINKYLKNYKS